MNRGNEEMETGRGSEVVKLGQTLTTGISGMDGLSPDHGLGHGGRTVEEGG